MAAVDAVLPAYIIATSLSAYIALPFASIIKVLLSGRGSLLFISRIAIASESA
jgi:hypothetical protein